MRPLTTTRLLTLAIFLTAFGCSAESSDQDRGAVVAGAAAPDIVLRGIDGRATSLSRLRGHIVVLAFNGVECPISKLLADRIRDIAAEYADRGVLFFGVNSNVTDGVEDLRDFARLHRIAFPMVKDEGAEIADALGAERTTDVFVFDAEGRQRFHGPVDDQYTLVDGRAMGGKSPSPDRDWLRETLDAVLAGRPVPAERVEAPG